MMTTRTSTLLDPLADIPHINEDPTRRALQAKRGELGTRLDGLKTRQGNIEQRITLRVSNQTASVERLLHNPAAEVDRADGLHEEHQKVLSDIDIVRRALVALDAQILQQEAERDGWACAMLKPAHRANVRATLNAQLALHKAVRQQESIRDGLVGKGYARTSQLVPHYHLDFRSGLVDPNSWLAGDLRIAAGEGFITEQERIALTQGALEFLDEASS